MFRPILAVCAILLFSASVRASEPKPLWEIETPGDKVTAPAWLGYSPDGTAIIAVVVHQGPTDPPEYTYKLRVWDAKTRKERFTAELGRGKTPTWGDELVAFPTDDSILTGGQTLTVRSLLDGKEQTTELLNDVADHAVWYARDLRESFQLRREPDRDRKPIELLFRSSANNGLEFSGKRLRGEADYDGLTRQTPVQAPRAGLRPQSIALNPGRNRVVAAFRDEASPAGQSRHALMHYRINTIDDFKLVVVGEATNPHGGTVSALTFAQDGKTLATGGDDGSICLWDVKDTESSVWKPRATIVGGDHRVAAMAFSPDWRVLAAITWDAKKPNLYLIDADTGRLIRSVRMDRDLTTVTWTPDGKSLLTGGHAGNLRAWEVETLLKSE